MFPRIIIAFYLWAIMIALHINKLQTMHLVNWSRRERILRSTLRPVTLYSSGRGILQRTHTYVHLYINRLEHCNHYMCCISGTMVWMYKWNICPVFHGGWTEPLIHPCTIAYLNIDTRLSPLIYRCLYMFKKRHRLRLLRIL